ncbi:MAG: hypothetical protein ACLFVE_07050 [Chitinispirillaceae bacterium]
MSVEVLLLAVLVGLTLLAYMIAINSKGTVKLIFSFFFATVMLAGSVWAIVQHFTAQTESLKAQELKQLEFEKRLAEEELQTREELGKHASVLSDLISTAKGYASALISADLQDPNLDLDGLMARAADYKRKVGMLRSKLKEAEDATASFPDVTAFIKEGIKNLAESCYYHRIYYYSETTPEETARERILRQKARNAQKKLQKADELLEKFESQ